MEKKSFSHIDLWKFIFAIAVIMIHTELFNKCSGKFVWYFSSLFTRLAVPFFMIVSGYFLGRKIREKGIDVIQVYRRALLPKFLFWGTLALLMNSVLWYWESKSITKTLLFIIQYAFFYPKGAMWFILALIVSSFILEFLLKRNVSVISIGIISLVLFSFALLCNTYFFIVSENALGALIRTYMQYCISARNGLFLFIYMFIGYALSSKRMNKMSQGTLILLVVIGYLLLLLEVVLLYKVDKLDDSSLFISYLVLIPAFILLLTTFSISIPHHKELRNISSVMYYTHPVFNLLLSHIMDVGVYRFLIVLTATIMVWVVTKSGNKYVKLLLY